MPPILNMPRSVNMENVIRLSHGSGGRQMQKLIHDLFHRHFGNRILNSMTDSAILQLPSDRLAFTSDSFVVDPLFFPGGNIGNLAICGTVNDLAVSGAKPLYISSSFIIEEGFHIDDLEKIVISMANEAKQAGVRIVTGDTKVVNRGKCDKIFINTAGIGVLDKKNVHISHGTRIREGDVVMINGTIGDHGMTVMNARESFNFNSSLQTDCTPLNRLIQNVLKHSSGIKFMRDATRGGVASVLCELAAKSGFGILIDEQWIPVKHEVRGMCELLGFDPLYVANEGKVVLIVGKNQAEKVLAIMKKNKEGKESAVIGEITAGYQGKVVLKTIAGGSRLIDLLSGDQLPRIC